MRILLAAACAVGVLVPAVAHAAWTGKGWCQVDRVDMAMGGVAMRYFWAGPFQSESACKGTLPKGDVMSKYSCEYLFFQSGVAGFSEEEMTSNWR